MNLPKNLILKAEEIEQMKRQNQLLRERNHELINQNYLLAKQIEQKWNQIEVELLDFHIMIQQLNLAKFFLLLLLWKLQNSLLKQKYLTEPFLDLDIEEIISAHKETQMKIQNLKDQRTKN